MKTQKNRQQVRFMAAMLLVLSLALGSTVSAYAAGDVPPDAPQPPVAAKEGDTEESVVILKPQDAGQTASTQATSYFQRGETTITYLGGKMMGVDTTTIATTTIYRVTSVAILEQYKDGKWQVFDVYQHSEYNDCMSSASMTRIVPAGYYYRGCGAHMTVHNNVMTRKDTVTGSLWLAK